MPRKLPPIRRIVTKNGPDGRSRIVEDGPPPAISTIATRPGSQVANMWITSATPAPVDAPDGIAGHKGLYPPKNGTIIRIMDIPPEPRVPEKLKAWFDRGAQASVFPDCDKIPADKTRHPGMHITDTVDYAIVLSGEMYAVMDEGETLMKAGDALVQRGTNHAWSNRSTEMCRVAFILIDGARS